MSAQQFLISLAGAIIVGIATAWIVSFAVTRSPLKKRKFIIHGILSALAGWFFALILPVIEYKAAVAVAFSFVSSFTYCVIYKRKKRLLNNY